MRRKEGLAHRAIRLGQPLDAVIYNRVSRDSSGRGKSVAEQAAANEAECRREGWTVAATMVDNSVSASRFATKTREQWQQLLVALEDRKYHVLVLWESSRGGRRLAPWAQLLELCQEIGVLIHITNDERTYDVRKSSDLEQLGGQGVRSAGEAEKISERLLRGKRGAADLGRPHGRNLYGYRRVYDPDTRELKEVVPDEQPNTAVGSDGTETVYTPAGVVRDMISRAAAGVAVRAIARDLNDRGIPTPLKGSKGWTHETVRHHIRNPAYAGLRVHQGTILGPAIWPPLVPPSVWYACVARFNGPDTRVSAREGIVKHLLTGLAVCGVCGSRVTASDPNTNPRYMCRPWKVESTKAGFCVSRSIPQVNEYVERSVLLRLHRLDIAGLLGEDEEADRRMEATRVEIAEKEARLEAARHAYATGELELDEWTALGAILKPEIAQARVRLQESRIGPVLNGLVGMSLQEIAAAWESRSIAERREVIRALTEKIEILKLGQGRRRYPPEESVRITWRRPH